MCRQQISNQSFPSSFPSFIHSKMSLPLTYKCGNCYINAYINMRHHYKDKSLKLVIGSLGINTWFEYGGKDWTKKDFQKKLMGFRSDSHCWLEDSDGNIYDFLFSEYEDWVMINTRRKMKRKGLLEGVPKAELARQGVQYVPAPKDAQEMLFLATFKHMKETHDSLISGKCSWYGSHISQSFTSMEEARTMAVQNPNKYSGIVIKA